VLLHSEYVLLCDIVIATPDTVFQDKPHLAFGLVPGDGMHVLWPEVIGSIRARYFLLTRQELNASRAQEWGVVNEVVPKMELLERARAIAATLVQLPPLTSHLTPVAFTQRLRRIVDEGVGYGLALEGISAAEVARSAKSS
jgi:enoyl-CoA hydratase/carnithine racemase